MGEEVKGRNTIFSAKRFLALVLTGFMLIMLAACSGDDGHDGVAGPSGTSAGTVSGTVTNSLTGLGVSGTALTLDPALEGVEVITDAQGAYSAELPIGSYSLSFAKEGYEQQTINISVVAGQALSRDIVLAPEAPVLVDIVLTGTQEPGAELSASVEVSALDNSTVQSIAWSQSNSVPVSLSGADTSTVTVTLPEVSVFKDELFTILATERGAVDGEDHAGVLLDRFMVQGFSHLDLEEAGHVALKVDVTTDSGVYTGTVDIHAALPFRPATGVNNVPAGLPVLLHGAAQADYDWNVELDGEPVAVIDANEQNPMFTPVKPGTYTVAEATSGTSFTVYVGSWMGAMGPEAQCAWCHSDDHVAELSAAWEQTGHASIFSTQLNTSTHYSTGCLECHTVGYNENVANGGIDDVEQWASFKADTAFGDGEGHFHADAENWDNLVSTYPKVARMANIQCENCHGPNQSQGHTDMANRVSLGSEVCGSCHGEPPRHGRYQQWQESAHAGYGLASGLSEGSFSGAAPEDEDCLPCHTAQGFIEWADRDFQSYYEYPSTPVDPAAAHPQTCVVCHDPHDIGTMATDNFDGKLRGLDGNTPDLPAGFKASNVGKGAICMVCHNSKYHEHNDVATPVMNHKGSHEGTQADVLMGENFFFVQTGVRGAHSLLKDTCVTCHMEKTDPPAELSYNLSGTNHTFEASLKTCAKCHDSVDGESLQTIVMEKRDTLKSAIDQAITEFIQAGLDAGNFSLLNMTEEEVEDADWTNFTGGTVSDVNIRYFHGRQAADITIDGTTYLAFINVIAAGGVNMLDTAEGQIIAKSGWNLIMIDHDRSHGVHNPSLILEVLAASQAQLKSLSAE